MKLNIMAAVMSFVSKLENESASFYQEWVGKFAEMEDLFSAWSKENKTFEKRVKLPNNPKGLWLIFRGCSGKL